MAGTLTVDARFAQAVAKCPVSTSPASIGRAMVHAALTRDGVLNAIVTELQALANAPAPASKAKANPSANGPVTTRKPARADKAAPKTTEPAFDVTTVPYPASCKAKHTENNFAWFGKADKYAAKRDIDSLVKYGRDLEKYETDNFTSVRLERVRDLIEALTA